MKSCSYFELWDTGQRVWDWLLKIIIKKRHTGRVSDMNRTKCFVSAYLIAFLQYIRLEVLWTQRWMNFCLQEFKVWKGRKILKQVIKVRSAFSEACTEGMITMESLGKGTNGNFIFHKIKCLFFTSFCICIQHSLKCRNDSYGETDFRYV
jgi:hypothetical protein